jgi:hypothetical protein
MHRHPLALFCLKPLNDRATDVVTHPENEHLASMLDNGEIVLDIGHVHPISGNTTILATLGRNGDVLIQSKSISKVQCSFKMDLSTGVVMFYDESHNSTTQVSGENATPFEYGRPRKVVVNEKFNTTIKMGGERRDLFKFELKWYSVSSEAVNRVKARKGATLEENPRLAQTIDDADTVLPSRRETRPHTAGRGQPKIRYRTLGAVLGYGQFGVVHKAVNVDTGKLMALKLITRPTGASGAAKLSVWKREVDVLSRLNHVSETIHSSPHTY